MSPEEFADDERASEPADGEDSSQVRERLDAGRERAVEGFDEGVVDVLSWVLDTETRAKIYVHLRKHPNSTSDEVAEGTGLYPSTVREALAELHEEGTVVRDKRESDGAGNNPYEYRAISPSALVRGAIQDVQDSLNAVFRMDRYVDKAEMGDEEPVTITVEEAEDDAGDADPAGEEDHGAEERDRASEDQDETAQQREETSVKGDEQDEDIQESL